MAALNLPRIFVPVANVPAQPAASGAATPPTQTAVWARFLIFLSLGLLVGAVIGWIIFPIELTGLMPEATNSPRTRQYIIAVADKYWRNLDAVEAHNALSQYDPVELAGIMAVVLQESKSAETRAHVAALAQALDLIPPETPFLAILAQPLLVLTFLFSLVPLAVGIWLVVLPAWREQREAQQFAEEDIAMGLAPGQTRRARKGKSKGQGRGARNPDGSFAEEEQDGTENENGIGDDVLPGVPGEENDDDIIIGAANPDGTTELPPLQPNAGTQETEEDVAEHAAEQQNILKDLANLFEEEDVSLSALEALCKKLSDITVDELAATAQDIVRRIKNNKPRSSARTPR